MLVTVEIPEEFAAKLSDRGVSPQQFMDEIVLRESRPNRSDMGSAAKFNEEQIQDFFANLTAIFKHAPDLSEEALTRESFYRDHD